ncbi:rRNA-processing protein EBP2-like isoform X2 [Sebastes umbrosus]|uniref:rRNA-processing protein EBP2-like isoform X2 n=1 Tax=Sebastes umbrosus TaxID=72105 RepID=UPI00189F6656|nr:rRNA-processing protein EBP2-like isoform X2 [Sebastes umbrosus]
MELQQQNKIHLEPIREESEREDEKEGSETGEGEEEEEEDVETKEVMAEDKSEEDEDDDAPLRVLRPRRLSRSFSRESFPQIQSNHNHQEETANFGKTDWSSHSVDLNDGATPPRQTRLGYKKMSTSGELRIKVSKVQMKAPKPSVQKKKNSKMDKMSLPKPFPEWLVDLMVNIEEATNHQLVVE